MRTSPLVPGGPAGNNGPTWALTLQDGLRLPNGSTVRETDNPTLRTTFAKLGIEGAHTDGRQVLTERYALLLKRIHDSAGARAVDEFLKHNGS